MTKKETYRLRALFQAIKHNKEADTAKSQTHEMFCDLIKEGIEICNKNIDRMKPLK